ncbi:acyltransferase family protein [Streptomyces fildesensis]|uniref:Acyltransferase family protein n=1 Tax=Streptomyces fildesensis TaxID=375757 RepID=A0ABW8CFT7_9ACTN
MTTSAVPAQSRAAETVGGRATGAPAVPRDAFFDNAKLLATVLVVLGHTWGPLVDNDPGMRGLRTCYLLVYSFHMPLFIMISGWFSRSFAENASDPGRLRRLLTSTVVPYVLFATAYQIYDKYRHDEPISVDLTVPFYLTWFLAALFVWRLSAPLWRTLRAPVLVATLVMLGAGFASFSGELDLGRVFQLLPFFVLGLTVRREHVQWVRNSRALRWAATPVFAAAFAAWYHYGPRVESAWLYRQSGHQQLGVGMAHWVVAALGLALGALILSLGFLALVPRRTNWFTSLGAGTQYTYLLHGFAVQMALAYDYEHSRFINSPTGLIALSAIAVLATGVLASPPVRRVLGWAVEPTMRWAFRSDRRPHRAA